MNNSRLIQVGFVLILLDRCDLPTAYNSTCKHRPGSILKNDWSILFVVFVELIWAYAPTDAFKDTSSIHNSPFLIFAFLELEIPTLTLGNTSSPPSFEPICHSEKPLNILFNTSGNLH